MLFNRYPALLAITSLATAGLTAQTRWSLHAAAMPFHGPCVATYDPVGNRTIAFAFLPSETWVLSGATGAWQLAAGVGPNVRYDQAIAFDEQRARAVLFGGRNPLGAVNSDVWEFDGTSWVMRQFAVVPPARQEAGLCFDSANGLCVLAGGNEGFAGAHAPRSDAWTYDGVAWAPIVSAVSPSGTALAVFDEQRARVVVLAQDGTFEWSGGAFTLVAGPAASPFRDKAAMSYDSRRQRVVLHGGRDSTGSSVSDTWEYDGSSWQQRVPLGAAPPRRQGHGSVFDTFYGVVRVMAGEQITVFPGYTTGQSVFEEWHYEPVSPATAISTVGACPWPLTIAADGLPWLGDTVTLSLPLASGSTSALFALGLSPLTPPVALGPLGWSACFLRVAPDVLLVAPGGQGAAEVALPIPFQPALLAMEVHSQAVDLAVGISDTLVLRIGGR